MPVQQGLREVDARLLELFKGGDDQLFQAAAHLLGGGKRIRPTLVLLSAYCLGGDVGRAVHAAIAVELLHVASLVQDDIMDGDDCRRDRPTVHRIFGVNKAILASDLLMQGAVREANTLGRRVVAELARAASQLTKGQDMDISMKDVRVSKRTYERMAMLKTGKLMGCALAEGAIVAGRRSKEIRFMRKAGELAGLAFQLRDDLMDWEAGERYASNAVSVFGDLTGLSVYHSRVASRMKRMLSTVEGCGILVDYLEYSVSLPGSMLGAPRSD